MLGHDLAETIIYCFQYAVDHFRNTNFALKPIFRLFQRLSFCLELAAYSSLLLIRVPFVGCVYHISTQCHSPGLSFHFARSPRLYRCQLSDFITASETEQHGPGYNQVTFIQAQQACLKLTVPELLYPQLPPM